jgi:hypothetical protein
MEEPFTSAQRRLEEAKERLRHARAALRVASQQGRLHLLTTLQSVIDAEELRVQELEGEISRSTR